MVYNIKMLTKVGDNGFPILHPSSTSSSAPNNLLEKLNSYHPSIKSIKREPSPPKTTSTLEISHPRKVEVQHYLRHPISSKMNGHQLASRSQRHQTVIHQNRILHEIDIVCYFENPIIPVHWFDERLKLGIWLPFCRVNEVESRKFLKRLNTYPKCRFNFLITWQTHKMESIKS